MNYGARIRELRTRAGLTQRDLERKLNLKESIVSTWERSTYPPLQAIEKLCAFFNITIDEFFYSGVKDAGYNDIPKIYLEFISEMNTLEENDRIYIWKQIELALDHLKLRKSS